MQTSTITLSAEAIVDLAKSVLCKNQCEWGSCEINLGSWFQLQEHLHGHCNRARLVDGKNFRCLFTKCSGQYHRSRKELKLHVTLSHLSRAWLPCPVSGCEERHRSPLLVPHFDRYHEDLVEKKIEIPNDLLKTTWRPFAPSLPPVLQPLPPSVQIQNIFCPPVQPSWRRKRAWPQPPPRRKNPDFDLQLSPRKRLMDSQGDDDDDEDHPPVTFKDLGPVEMQSIETKDYVVRQRPPHLDEQMSKALKLGLRGAEPGKDAPEAPSSILWDAWLSKVHQKSAHTVSS